MKRMASGGFTIVESMIVLSITGVLFISLAAMMSGQQSKARFKASMTDITTQIQSQINEVATGYYPNTGDFTCSMSGGMVQITDATTGNAQGTNKECTFLGRALMYAIPNTDPEEYRVQTLVGVRKTIVGREPLTLSEAGTRPLAPGTSVYNAGWKDRSDVRTLLHGVQVVYMRSLNGGGTGVPQRISGLAVVAAPNQQVSYNLNGVAESGTVIPTIIPIPNTLSPINPGLSPKEGVDALVTALGLPTSTASASQGPIEICFKSGTTAQSGLVTIGRNHSATAVDLTIYDNTGCV